MNHNISFRFRQRFWHFFRALCIKTRSKINLFLWRIFHDLEVGHGTVFRGLRAINTTFGSIKIGKDCRINAIALVGPIEIGDNVLVNLLSDISGRSHKVTIGNNVLIAPQVSILASAHNFLRKDILIKDQGTSGGDIEICDDVWIGTRAVIMPGVRLGKGVVIGANAIVTEDIPDYAVAVGIPAKIIRYRE